jgi:hypothetical protein
MKSTVIPPEARRAPESINTSLVGMDPKFAAQPRNG